MGLTPDRKNKTKSRCDEVSLTSKHMDGENTIWVANPRTLEKGLSLKTFKIRHVDWEQIY